MLRHLPARSGSAAICLLLLVVAVSVTAQGEKVGLAQVYVGADGFAHIVDSTGADVAMPKEKGQVAVSGEKLADDEQTAGWLIEQENCCTSYSIPTSLAMYRIGKKRLLLRDGLMIYDWCFVANGKHVAMSGAVHGMTSRHLLLYDIASGRRLREWNGAMDADAPSWGKDLKQ